MSERSMQRKGRTGLIIVLIVAIAGALAAGALARVTDSMEHRRAELARIYGAAVS